MVCVRARACMSGYAYTVTSVKNLHSALQNKMQSKTADFAPVPPPGELEETLASSLILAYSL